MLSLSDVKLSLVALLILCLVILTPSLIDFVLGKIRSNSIRDKRFFLYLLLDTLLTISVCASVAHNPRHTVFEWFLFCILLATGIMSLNNTRKHLSWLENSVS